MDAIPPRDPDVPLDVLIVGAGLSGIGLACTLARELPEKTCAIVEAREALGGTWDLFRYPGIRSDSDLFTFAYDFKPWKSRKAIAGAGEILAYLREAAEEHGVLEKIRYRQKVVSADWDTGAALWTVTVDRSDLGAAETIRCRWLFGATGYYDYDQGHRPHFPEEEAFAGPIIHPQAWPEAFDHKGKRIVVIGSGATAVTLVPALAREAAHVTQIQRTPSYVMATPSEDGLANLLRRWLPPDCAHAIARRKNILRQQWTYALFQRYPRAARRLIRWANRKALPEDYPVDVHFNPPYKPWDQRLCAAPDGDFFKEIRSGRVSIMTGEVDRFTPGGVVMASGEEIAADVIVVATGLKLKLFGGVQLRVDGAPVVPPERIVFKGTMLDGVPNFCFAVGYTNSSWTLKVGLLCRYFCRLLKEMDARGDAVCVVDRPKGETGARPLLTFGAGYVRRSLHELPRQGSGYPWEMTFDYGSDERLLTRGAVVDPAMRLTPAPKALAASAA
jgi:monooxygenase